MINFKQSEAVLVMRLLSEFNAFKYVFYSPLVSQVMNVL